MSGIDDLNFEDLIDGAINTIDDAKTEKFEAKLIQPKSRGQGKPPVLGGKLTVKKGSEVVGDETIETMLDDTARMEDPGRSGPPEVPKKGASGKATFDHIYMRAGVQPHEFTVFRVEELFNDEDLSDLDIKGRVAAVRAILKSHDVEFELVVEDAVARRNALDAHDQRLKSNIQRVEREMEKENAKLQAEIEEYANPRIERMEKNNERVERLRSDYADWLSRKQEEQNRIVSILEPWGGDDRLRPTEKVGAVPGESVSGDEAFEPQPKPEPERAPETITEQAVDAEVEAPQPVHDSVVAQIDADQWDFDEESSVGIEDSVTTDYEPDDAPAGLTDDFDFGGSKMRIPRTAVQWFFALFVFALALPVTLLLAAQLDMIATPGTLFVGFFAPIVFAVIPTFLTRNSENFWSGGIVWWFVGVLIAFGVAHYDPANLTKNLTKRPLWFIDEAGLNTQAEEATFAFTGAYAEAIAPLLGTTDAIWKAPAKDGGKAAPPSE